MRFRLRTLLILMVSALNGPAHYFASSMGYFFVKSSSTKTQSSFSPLDGASNFRFPEFSYSPIGDQTPVRGSYQWAFTDLPESLSKATVIGLPEGK